MNKKEIREKLPIGGMTEISKISGINLATVQRFFKGEKTKLDIEVMEATTKYLSDYKAKESKALQELKAVASA